MRWLEENIPWVAKLDNVTLKWFFFYFISSCLLGNNRSVLTCRLLTIYPRAYAWFLCDISRVILTQ